MTDRQLIASYILFGVALIAILIYTTWTIYGEAWADPGLSTPTAATIAAIQQDYAANPIRAKRE